MALGFGHLLCGTHRAAVEIHQAPVRRGMRKDHAAAAPVTGRMRPTARRRIAHAALLRQRQGNTTLTQVRCATTAGQGDLEGSELLSQIYARRGRRTRRRWARYWLPGSCRRRLALAWHSPLASWRPPECRLALLLLAPPLAGLCEVAPGATRKADEAPAAELHA